MKYLEFTFRTVPCTEIVNDVLSGVLGEAGFESFVEQTDGITAYIQKDLYSESRPQRGTCRLPPARHADSIQLSWKPKTKTGTRNGRRTSSSPSSSETAVSSTALSTTMFPQAEYDIVINPQMAFGTGHHETTSLIIGELLDSDLQGKALLDMGCGTSILAILARMRGASPCTAIDIDEWCVRNSLENIALNGVDNIAVSQGDASSLESKGPFDMVIANINRNILLADMKHYIARMNPGAELLMSGFYIDDIPVIREEAERNGLHFVHHREKNRWAAVKFRK